MWNFKYIALKRFISHLDTYYEFQEGVAVPITGLNKTDEGQKANGSGKSALIEGIHLAITGDPFRAGSAKEIIMDYQSDTEIETELINEAKGLTMRIYRKISQNKSAVVQLYVNGKLREDLKDLHPRETNKEIEKLLGISFEDFTNYYILSNDHHKPFFLATDGQKKMVVNRFSKANVVDKCIADVAVDIAEKDKQIVAQEKAIIKVESVIESINDDISDWKQKESEITPPNKSEELSKQKIAISEEEEVLTRLKKTLTDKEEALQSKIKDKEVDQDVATLNKQIEEYKQELKILKEEEVSIVVDKKALLKEQTEYEKKVSKLEVILQGELECPKCQHQFIPESDVDPKQAKTQIEKNKKEIKSLKDDIESCDIDLKNIEADKEASDKEIEKIEEKLQKVTSFEKLIKVMNEDIEDHLRKIKNKEESIKQLKATLAHTKTLAFVAVNPYPKQIEEAEEKRKIKQSELDKLNIDLSKLVKEKEEIERWTIYFKQFKSHLANLAIGSIEGYTNFYLQKIHTNLQVQIEGYRLLADNKTIKEEITVEVLRDNGLPKVFQRFSGGEKARINIANILAMQQMINDTSVNGGLNFLGLDEVCESLDLFGISSILHSLSSLKKTVLMINQARTEGLENELVVLKENGVSILGKMQLDKNNEEQFVPYEN